MTDKDWNVGIIAFSTCMAIAFFALLLWVAITQNTTRVITYTASGYVQEWCVSCENTVVFAATDTDFISDTYYCTFCGKKFTKTIMAD